MSSVIFNLNRPNGVYFDNDFIEGRVTLTTTKVKYIKDIKINFNGRSKVLWETDMFVPRGAEESDTPRCIFRGEETFIDQSLTARSYGFLLAGTYDYNFRFQNKPGCPSSCEGRYGHVRYELSLVIHRYDTYSNVFKHGVTVIRNFDLNQNDKYWINSVETRSSKGTLTACLCALVNIYFVLKTPFCAYTPGQYINYTLELHRHSTDNIIQCDVQLIKKMVFTAERPIRKKLKTKNVLVDHSFTKDHIASNIIENDILIPPIPPTSSPTDLVYVKYYLEARAYLNCCIKSKLFAKHEITIGSEPLMETLTTNERMAMRNEVYEMAARGNVTPQINARRASTAVSSNATTVPFVDHDNPSSSILYYPLYSVFQPYHYDFID